jgi:hypothetical protein
MAVSLRLIAIAAAALIGNVAAFAAAPEKVQPRAVIELFTSQGCSSCPPADALMVELSKNAEIVALTMPVTYWDYLGWKDTLGKDSFAKRQKLYSKARGDGQVYTPQAVVNGVAHMIGSDKAEIARAMSEQLETGLAARVALEEDAGNLRIHVAPNGGDGSAKGGIWLLPTTRLVTVPIARGENQGKTISYVNVVRGLLRIGDWDGKDATVTVPLATTRAAESDSYVVLVQAEQPGRYGQLPAAILGVARSGP